MSHVHESFTGTTSATPITAPLHVTSCAKLCCRMNHKRCLQHSHSHLTCYLIVWRNIILRMPSHKHTHTHRNISDCPRAHTRYVPHINRSRTHMTMSPLSRPVSFVRVHDIGALWSYYNCCRIHSTARSLCRYMEHFQRRSSRMASARQARRPGGTPVSFAVLCRSVRWNERWPPHPIIRILSRRDRFPQRIRTQSAWADCHNLFRRSCSGFAPAT